MSQKEFSTIKINGNDLNMWMIKPADFDAQKEYPLLMFQYSGPGSQQVANRWNGTNDYWHQMLAQQGMIIVCVDGRGTGLKGRDFKKVTQKELGKFAYGSKNGLQYAFNAVLNPTRIHNQKK